jgi:hypothetical protein
MKRLVNDLNTRSWLTLHLFKSSPSFFFHLFAFFLTILTSFMFFSLFNTKMEPFAICSCPRGVNHVTLPSWTGIDPMAPSYLMGGAIHLSVNLDFIEQEREDLLQQLEGIRLKKARMPHTVRGDYSACIWYRYLDVSPQDPINDPESLDAVVFETRFRILWLFYQQQLLPWTLRRYPLKADAFGRLGMPIEFKLLAVLRVLGRGMHFDDVAEYIGCGFKGEALRVFYHDFM